MEQNNIFLLLSKHLTEDEKPSLFIENLSKEKVFNDYPFSMLLKLKGSPQPKEHHPEGDAWVHTLMVVDEAARVKNQSSSPLVFMWAALLHDIGKPVTTKIVKGKIISYSHDIKGAFLAGELLKFSAFSESEIKEITALVRWHMQPLFFSKNVKGQNFKKMLSETNVNDISMLCLCDRLGRKDIDRNKAVNVVEQFKEKCLNISK